MEFKIWQGQILLLKQQEKWNVIILDQIESVLNMT